MAILGKIRSKGVLLLIIVGSALLLFIVNDALTQGSSYFNKSKERVAEIAGEDVNIKDYSELIDQINDVYKIEYNTSELNEDAQDQLRNAVWESLVNEKLLNAEAKKLGLSVSEEELTDRLIGNNIHPIIMQRPVFVGENGRFSRTALMRFYETINQTPENEEQRQQIERYKSYWLYWERTVKNRILQEKYNALLGKAITANKLDAQFMFDASKNNTDVNYVEKQYFTISDSTIAVSQSEIKDLYNKKKTLFKQDANRAISYVMFNVKPSPEDYKKAENEMNKLSEEFKTTDDPVAFVNQNSEIRFDDNGYTAATVPASLKDFAFGSATGAINGPSFANDTYTMARVVANGIMESDSVKLRHIFLTTADATKTDSIVNAIKAGANFAELAKKYSAVQQTAANGGEIGWLARGMAGLDKEITAKAFSNAINGIFTISNNQGTQIMQVMEKTPARSKVKLAILEIKVSTSNTTVSKIYNEAKQFAAELKGSEFAKRAQEKGYNVRIANELTPATNKVNDISQSRQVIRWAFENGKGDVSDVFDCSNKFVVAYITEINDKGVKPVEKVADQLKAEIIRDKKADIIIKDLSAQLNKNPSLENLASTLGTDVKTATGVNFSAYQFGVAGFEPAVIGKISTLAPNKISAPIKGNSGVFVVLPTNQQANGATFDANLEIRQLNSRLSYSLPYMVMNNIRDNADITDNRLNFY
ncbi:MAG: SurA N-terminal domain-containing protein [Paludibacter sp.]|nr:SurA N-terminal domain-containing protein [Paludibacter sp.]